MSDVTTNGPDLYAQLAYRMRVALGEFNDPNRDLEGLVRGLVEFKRAHLTQSAQSVDVEKVREVIARLRSFRSNTPPTWAHLDDAADKLAAALQEGEG